MSSITCEELAQRQRTEEITLLDVRLREVREAAPLTIEGAIWLDPERSNRWIDTLPKNRPVIVFCAHGRSISQGITKELNALGWKAHYLSGGLAAWIEERRIVV